MYINRKGYTIVELIIVLAVIGILSTVFMRVSQSYDSYLNRINIDYCNNSIMILINNSKSYCSARHINGKIAFDSSQNSISFYSGGNVVNKFAFPSKFRLSDVNLGPGKYTVDIDSSGFTNDACTISYLDRKGVIHKVTICVGTAYVEIKG